MNKSNLNVLFFAVILVAFVYARIAMHYGWTPMLTNILTWLIIGLWLLAIIINLFSKHLRKRYEALMIFGFSVAGGMAVAILVVLLKSGWVWKSILTWFSITSVVLLMFGLAMRQLYLRECREVLAKNHKRSQQRRREKALNR